MKHLLRATLIGTLSLLALTGCVIPQSPKTCLSGTFLIKGTGPATKPHLHVGRELYALDFVSSDGQLEAHATDNFQGKVVKACGGLTPEPMPMPSRLRVDSIEPVAQQVQ